MTKEAKTVPAELLKPYDPGKTEDRIYRAWEESGYFNPDHLPERHTTPFSIVLPPPNATGTLHVGGALMTVIQDIIIRQKRMAGCKALWLPGTDHAAIATNAKVEKLLQKEEGKSRHDIGREAFVAKVEKFVEENRGALRHQISKMGASLDWSREAFTFDEKRNFAVRTAFKRMYDAGIIYRGTRIINWDPKGQTTISDDEIVHEERTAKLYTFKYASDFPIAISSTRPETKLGDTAVAVHPSDERYKAYVGKTFSVAFAGTNLTIKVVADESVDPEFGTGALGVTPAHSQIDAEIAKRHDLPFIQVINEYAKIALPIPGLEGEKVIAAREKIVVWLKENGLLIEEKEIPQSVATAERTGGVIEPLPKLQWFVDVNRPIALRGNKSLKELMYEAVSSKRVKILPEHFEKIYFHWINNLRDWNISRQVWYGHRVPVWYHQNCQEIEDGNFHFNPGIAAVGELEVNERGFVRCKSCSNQIPVADVDQDPDTLDTWFSSGLWTFSTLGWPEETTDLRLYHPTDVLETGYDILFFWVARMILMSQFLLGTIPFKTVYLHGLVRNEKGQKLSKSLGDNVDPLSIIATYGTDALRMALIVGVGPGSDSKLGNDKLKAYKNFANKLWNITRFILENASYGELDLSWSAWSAKDAELIAERDALIAEITKEMEEYKFYLVAEKLYHYAWHSFADKVLEESKKIFAEGTEEEQASRRQFLLHTLRLILTTLHPFMPFVTEELWRILGEKNLLLVEKWPR